MKVEETPDGMWIAHASWGRVDGKYVKREAAEAVAALPVPSTERLLEEGAYWKDLFYKLLGEVQNSSARFEIVTYKYTGARSPGPLERYVMTPAIRAHFAAEKVANETEQE